MTALQDIISRIEEQMVFDPELGTTEATYKRRINSGERLSAVRCAYLPIRLVAVTVSGIGEGTHFTGGVIPRECKQDERQTIAIFWVLVADMKWHNGDVFEPKYGDTFSYTTGTGNHHYTVMDFSFERVTVRDPLGFVDEQEYVVWRILAEEEA